MASILHDYYTVPGYMAEPDLNVSIALTPNWIILIIAHYLSLISIVALKLHTLFYFPSLVLSRWKIILCTYSIACSKSISPTGMEVFWWHESYLPYSLLYFYQWEKCLAHNRNTHMHQPPPLIKTKQTLEKLINPLTVEILKRPTCISLTPAAP